MRRARGAAPAAGLWLAALVLAAAGAPAGCGSTLPCKPGTMFITVHFEGDAARADNVHVLVSADGDAPRDGMFPHGAGSGVGTIEVDFPAGYQAGRNVQIIVTALQGEDVALATATMSTVLTTGCTTLSITVSPVNMPGGTGGMTGAAGGAPGAGGGAGQAGNGVGGGGMAGTGVGGGAAGGNSDAGLDVSGAGGMIGTGGSPDAGGDRPGDGGCVATPENCFNGIDDDCNGHIDCDDSACAPVALCVPAAGAFAAGAYVDPSASCPSGFGAGETAINATLAPGAGCTGCSCQTSITCTVNVARYANALACTALGTPAVVGSIRSDYAAGAAAPTTNCQVASFSSTTAPSVDIYVTSNAPCTPQGPPVRSTPSWGTSRKFCGAGNIGGGCVAGSVCVPRSSVNHCVLGTGAQVCPAGYTKDGGSWYTGFNDARVCGACTCGTQTPGNCTALRASFYMGAGCNTAVVGALNSNTKDCNAAASQSVGFSGTPAVPTCPASTTTTGSVTPTGEQTLCCL